MHPDRLPYRWSDYSIRIAQEPTTDGDIVYGAWYEELPGCESQGDSEEEARENLRDAFELYMTDLLERGLAAPPPATTRVHEVVSHIVVTTGPATVSAGATSIHYGAAVGFTTETEAPRPLVGTF